MQEKERVDISKEAEAFEVYSSGNLDEIDKEQEIRAKWFRERIIVLLAVFIIASILIASVIALGWSTDETTRDWARQSLTALLGFGAGAVFSKSKGGAS